MNSTAQIHDILSSDTEPELLKELSSSVREYLQSAEASLLTLERQPGNLEAVNTCMGALHTIKGTSACLGLTSIAELCHQLESFLSPFRAPGQTYSTNHAGRALRGLDLLKHLFRCVDEAATGKPLLRPASFEEVIGLLSTPVAQDESPKVLAASKGPVDYSATEIAPRNRAEAYMRVRTERLDQLVNLIGELVIAQSMVTQDESVKQAGGSELQRKVLRASKIVRELQDLSLTLRMMPLRMTFQTLGRIVRDLGNKSGKQVDLDVDGEETEIDRSMVDVIDMPLAHMVRNAMDHGIEAPAERRRLGKPAAGTIKIRAYHAHGNVVIELSDDGQGLNRDRIHRQAVAQGLVRADAVLSDDQAHALIFAPGFSTADEITEVSGRGVGMHVVKKAVDSLRGRIEISSHRGQGTTFRLCLPLTLAVRDGMLVRVGSERYLIPTVAIVRTFRPEPAQLSTLGNQGEMVLLRGELVPIVRLSQVFGLGDAPADPCRGLLVVIKTQEQCHALLVDELLGQIQVVTKSLGEGIGRIPGVSGGAILGDGKVGLILDPGEIALAAHASSSAATDRLPHLEAVA